MRLFGRSKAVRIDEEEKWALLALPYAADLGWDLARLRRVRNLEEQGAEFVVRRPAFGNQAVLTMASFPTEEELTSLVAAEWGGGLFTLCAGARVLCTYRLAGSETATGTSRQRSAGTALSFRHRLDEILADRLEDALAADPDLAREVIGAAVRSHFHLPLPAAPDRWDEMALQAVEDSPAYRDQLAKNYLRKQGIDVEKPQVDPLDRVIEHLTKEKKIQELLGGGSGRSSRIGAALMEAVKPLVDTLNGGQLLELVRAVQLLRTQTHPHAQESPPAQQESPAPHEAPAADPAAPAPDPGPEGPPTEPAPSASPKTEIPDPPPTARPAIAESDLLDAARSIYWQGLLREILDGPASFIETASQSALEAPEMPLGKAFHAVRDNDPAAVAEFLLRVKPSLLQDPFRRTVIEQQGRPAFDAVVRIIDFFATDAGMAWLASAQQIALALGSNDHESGLEGAVGDSPESGSEPGPGEQSVEAAPEVR